MVVRLGPLASIPPNEVVPPQPRRGTCEIFVPGSVWLDQWCSTGLLRRFLLEVTICYGDHGYRRILVYIEDFLATATTIYVRVFYKDMYYLIYIG